MMGMSSQVDRAPQVEVQGRLKGTSAVLRQDLGLKEGRRTGRQRPGPEEGWETLHKCSVPWEPRYSLPSILPRSEEQLQSLSKAQPDRKTGLVPEPKSGDSFCPQFCTTLLLRSP
jgi:hypothetical protein